MTFLGGGADAMRRNAGLAWRFGAVVALLPRTAAEVRGPAPGPMTKAYVQMVGRMAYLWGWPLVYVYNQRTALEAARSAMGK